MSSYRWLITKSPSESLWSRIKIRLRERCFYIDLFMVLALGVLVAGSWRWFRYGTRELLVFCVLINPGVVMIYYLPCIIITIPLLVVFEPVKYRRLVVLAMGLAFALFMEMTFPFF
jgi:hypothetical protein